MRSGILVKKGFIKFPRSPKEERKITLKISQQSPSKLLPWGIEGANYQCMFTISLNNLIFFSFHGVHVEERILGNKYEVNVELSFNAYEQITTLKQTINYASVYEIIKQRMNIPAKLLETLAQDLAQKIVDLDNRITSIMVAIEKKNPPISNMEGSVSVKYKKDF